MNSTAHTAASTKVATKVAATAPTTASAAAVVSLSDAAKTQLAKLATGSTTSATETSATSGIGVLKSFDEIVQDRTKALADKLGDRLTNLGVPQDEPINLQIDSLGQIKTDSPYKKKIEKMFKDDPDLAKEFKDVASLNAMKAAQKALEAFEEEKKAARNDEERDAAYGRYTARLMTSQDLSGTMTLDDGKLRSASVEFMDESVGEAAPAKASTKAEQVAAKRVSLTA